MSARILGTIVVAGTVLLSLCPAMASAADELVFDNYAFKGGSLDSVEQEAIEAIAAEAVEKVYRATEAATPDQKQARSRTLEEAKRNAREIVKYTVIDGPRKRPGAPGYIVVRATVQRSAIERIYKSGPAAGAPRKNYIVMVVIAEEHCVERPLVYDPNYYTYDLRPDSMVVRAIEQTLIKRGFKVKNGNMLDEIRKRKIDFAKLDGADAKIAQQIAADKGCDIVILGRAKADGPSPRDIGTGQTYYYWKADAKVTACFTATAETIWSDTITGPESGDRIKFAGREIALEKAGYEIAEKFVDNLKPHEIRSEIAVTLTGVKDLDQAAQIVEWLEKAAGAGTVSSDLERGVFKAQVKTTMGGMDLAMKVRSSARSSQAGFSLELTDTSSGTVTGRVVLQGAMAK